MVVSSEMTSSTIEAMKNMAADPRKRAALVKDEACLGGLVMVLSNKDTDVVTQALETLCLLAECPDHRTHMKTFIGMMEQLSSLVASPSKMIQELSNKIYNLLIEASECLNASGLRDTSNHQHRNPHRDHLQKKQNLFGGRKLSKSKVIVLQIKGLKDKSDVELCRSHILKVKGVVSITFDLQKKRSIIRTKSDLKVENLAVAVSKTEVMSAEQVIKDEAGNEVLLSFGASVAECDKENRLKTPDYPPSDEDDTDYSGHPARFGEPKKEDNGGWDYVKKLGSFLSSSLYW